MSRRNQASHPKRLNLQIRTVLGLILVLFCLFALPLRLPPPYGVTGIIPLGHTANRQASVTEDTDENKQPVVGLPMVFSMSKSDEKNLGTIGSKGGYSAITGANGIATVPFMAGEATGAVDISTVIPKTSSTEISSGCLPGALDPGPADCDTSLVEDSITPGAIGSRTPLILIHGIWGGPDYFTNLLSHFESISGYLDFKARYKVYRFEWDSDEHAVWEIARSLRNWLDYKAKLDLNVFKNIVIIAHSTGGLIARSYMNEHDTDYDPATGGRTRKRAGERVKYLITLATPHHGSPLSNENVRVPNSYVTWNAVVGTADLAWGVQGCWPCVNDPEHSNRGDLRSDNHGNTPDSLWPWAGYNKRQERNDWLRNIPHTYDSKIIAYGGYIGTNTDIVDLGQARSGPLLAILGDRAISHKDHLKLNASSVLLDRIFYRNFVSTVNQVYNDGAVPISSSLFYGQQVRRVTCPGYDHT